MALRFDSWINALTIKIPSLFITSPKAFSKTPQRETRNKQQVEAWFYQKGPRDGK